MDSMDTPFYCTYYCIFQFPFWLAMIFAQCFCSSVQRPTLSVVPWLRCCAGPGSAWLVLT